MKFRNQPEDILKSIGIYQPSDIDLDLIAHSLNAQVQRSDLSDCEGYIVGTESRAIITINKDACLERQRFSLGHELGHWVNDKKQNLTYRCDVNDMRQRVAQKNSFRQQKEVRANQFSAELLIPKHIAANLITGLDVTFDSVKYLAELFKVSKTSTAIRLVELSPLPCILVCWSMDGKRKWFFRSEIIPDSIWPYKNVKNPQALANKSTPIEVDAEVWIDHENSCDYTLIQSCFSNSYDILTLLWWKDESQLLELGE